MNNEGKAAHAAPSGEAVISMLRRAMDQAKLDAEFRAALTGHFVNEWNKAAASPAPETAQADDLLNAEELAALRRFDECAQDGEGYDVPREMMQRLAEIGVVRRKSGAYYEATNFGMRVLDRAPSAATGKAAAANAGGQIAPQSVSDERKAFEEYWNKLEAGDATEEELEMYEAVAWLAWQARPRHCLALPLSAYVTGTTYKAIDSGGQTDREAFEAWHRSKFATKHLTGQPTRDMHNGIYAEQYGPTNQQQMWEAWQAATSATDAKDAERLEAIAVKLDAKSAEAETWRENENNEFMERIWLGAREGFDEAARIVRAAITASQKRGAA